MFDARRFLHENRGTVFMLFFLAALYSVLFIADRLSPPEVTPLPSAAESVFTADRMKEKEAAALRSLEAHPKLAEALSLSFLAVLAAGLAVDIYLAARLWRGRPWIAPDTATVTPRWGLGEVAKSFVFLFFIEGVIFLGQVFWHWAAGAQEMQHDLWLLGSSLLRDTAVAAFVVYLVRARGQSWKELGFRTEHFLKNVRRGLIGYTAMVPPMLVGFTLLAGLMQLFSYEPQPQNVVQIYLKKSTGPYLLLFTVFVALLGPVLEELFFRGFAYPALRQKIGRWAMPAVAAVFAGFHMNLVAFLPIFLLGFFLTYLYEATGSLVPSLTAHVLHNTLMVVITLGFRALAGAT